MVKTLKEALNIIVARQEELGYKINVQGDLEALVKNIIERCLKDNDGLETITSRRGCKELLKKHGRLLVENEVSKPYVNFDKALDDFARSFAQEYIKNKEVKSKNDFFEITKDIVLTPGIDDYNTFLSVKDALHISCNSRKIEFTCENSLKILDDYFKGKYNEIPRDVLSYLNTYNKIDLYVTYVDIFNVRTMDDCFKIYYILKQKGLTDDELAEIFKKAVKEDLILLNIVNRIANNYKGFNSSNDIFSSFIKFLKENNYKNSKEQDYLDKKQTNLYKLDHFLSNTDSWNTAIKAMISLVYNGTINGLEEYDLIKEEFILLLLESAISLKKIYDEHPFAASTVYNAILGENTTLEQRRELLTANNNLLNKFLINDINKENLKMIIDSLSYDDINCLVCVFYIMRVSQLTNRISITSKKSNEFKDQRLNKLNELLNNSETLEALREKTSQSMKVNS